MAVLTHLWACNFMKLAKLNMLIEVYKEFNKDIHKAEPFCFYKFLSQIENKYNVEDYTQIKDINLINEIEIFERIIFEEV